MPQSDDQIRAWAAALAEDIASGLEQGRAAEWLEEVLGSALLDVARRERERCAGVVDLRVETNLRIGPPTPRRNASCPLPTRSIKRPASELVASIERLHTDPGRRAGMPSLVDCRGVQQMLVTPVGVQAAATLESVLVDPAQQPWAVAIIAPQEEVYWVARTYEVLRVGSPEKVRVFRDALEAEGWVKDPRG